MILIFEPICYGYEHVPINVSVIRILLAGGEKEILYYGEEKHCKMIRNELESGEQLYISFNSTILPSRKSVFYERFLTDLKNIYSILVDDSKSVDLLVIASANSSVLISIKLVKSLFNKSIKCKIILHGGVRAIEGWRSKNPFLRMIDFTNALSWLNSKTIEYFVLERSIYDNVIKILPKIHPFLKYIDHPIQRNITDVSPLDICGESVIRIGFLGVVNEAKGFDEFFWAAEKIAADLPEVFKFYVIGFSQETNCRFSEIFEYGPKYEPVERSEYLRMANMMHYVCLPYKEGHYKYSASGALLDAISLKKPIIASDIEIFSTLFKKYGSIGYIFKEGELYNTILILKRDHNNETYSEFVNRLSVISEDRLPKNQLGKFLSCAE